MEISIIIAISVAVISIVGLFITGGAQDTAIKLIYLGTALALYFGCQYLFGPKGKLISLIIFICYGVFAWRIKQIGNVVLWPTKKQ